MLRYSVCIMEQNYKEVQSFSPSIATLVNAEKNQQQFCVKDGLLFYFRTPNSWAVDGKKQVDQE